MPSRDEIKPLVIEKIEAVVEPDFKVKEDHDLFVDLGMGATVKKAMGVPYTKISKKFEKGLTVSMMDAGKCRTVKNSIDLVHKRANGDSK